MQGQPPIPPKDSNVLDRIHKAVAASEHRYTDHAQSQMLARSITSREVSYILKNGYHEATKDSFDSRKECWKYAVRGMTVDGRDIRVVVSFANRMMIITVIDKDN